MIRLFIENQELDINDSLSHQITYAVDDLKNLDAKATSFSKTLIIPGTANNNKLFGNIFQFSNSNFNSVGPNVGYNFNASKSAKALLQSNGLTIIKGVLRLLEIVIDGEYVEYEVAIFGELGGFISALGNKKLEELDYSYWNHTYNTTKIKDSWTLTKNYSVGFGGNLIFKDNYVLMLNYVFPNLAIGDTIEVTGTFINNGTYTVSNYIYITNGHTKIVFTTNVNNFNEAGTVTLKNKRGIGYYYPLIDYGNQSTNKKDYQYKTFRPAIFVYDYITRIINESGYSWNSNFFKSDFFTRLIIPHNDKLFYNYSITSYGTGTKSTSQTSSGPLLSGQYKTELITFNSTASLVYFTFNGGYRFKSTTRSTINISANIQGSLKSYTAAPLNLQISRILYLNKVTSQGTEQIEIADFGIDYAGNYNINVNKILSFEIDEEFYFSMYTRGDCITINTIDLKLEKSPPGFIEYQLNDSINVNYAIPKNVLQKDFFTSILKMFNLIVTEDKLIEKRLNIEPWVDFYNLDRTTYKDWTGKIDRSNVIKIKPMSEINARYYQFKFKSDSDYYNELYKKKYNEGYGDMTFDNKLEFAKDSSSSEVIFSASPLIGWSGEDKVVSCIFKWDGVSKGVNEEAISSNIRIMQCKPVSGVTSWAIKDSGTTLASQTTYGYAGHFDSPDAPNADLNFGATNELYFTLVTGGLQNNMFNAYYSPYMAEITDKDSRLVTAKIKLTEQDIYNLEFGKFIYVDGVLYRLQRIIDYSAGEICTVELLRVIYTQY